MRVLILALGLLAAVVLHPADAQAHAELLATSPPDGAVLDVAPAAIELVFNEPVRPIAVELIGADGKPIATPGAPGAQDRRVRLALPAALPDGAYLATYRVVSADGHPIGGALQFSVGAPSRLPKALYPLRPDAAGLPALLLHAAQMLAIVFVAGLALAQLWWRDSPAMPILIRPLAWAGAGLSLLLIPVSGAELLGETPWTLDPLPLWHAGLTGPRGQGALVALAGFTLIGLGWRLAGAALALGSFALFGHARAAGLGPAALLALHVALAAFWLGALPLFAYAWTEPGRDLVARLKRFSLLALPAVLALTMAGLALTFLILISVADLWSSSYGVILSAKLVAFGGLLALAAANRTRLLPALMAGRAGATRWLGRAIRAEIALGIVVLLLTALLSRTAPPHAPGLELILDASDGSRAFLALSPGQAGANRIELRLVDAAGHRLPAMAAWLTLAPEGRAAEALRRPLDAQGIARFGRDRLDLPFTGQWEIGIEADLDDFHRLAFTGRLTLP